ncbi:hypothetical protein GYMLUDRAFT_250153 [Collybiopsis luxurians FD-317 M1]|uniref:Uncharacterized protein n=1 Tax=Collybiopsis luxurians FD-317 M1 TaxID=944289 RepID=A0A0D0CFG8_9AGAR|nr:hypothetical protein GYMLUDRAFT_250153 [Collybiopsis luxurians FD-317 M1]
MGPGSHWDTMDDHFADHNWRKLITLVQFLSSRAEDVLKKHPAAVVAFLSLSSGLDPTTVRGWEDTVKAWESDSMKPNPFVATVRSLSYRKVGRQLAQKDEIHAREAPTIIDSEISASQLIVQGLELEELQRRFEYDLKELGKHATDLQKVKLKEHAVTLHR